MSIFQGIGVALITPFDSNKNIDLDTLKNMVDHVINGGVDYIVALGTTAETPTLSAEEKKNILKTIINHTNKRVPVVCGIGGNNTQEVINTIQKYSAEFEFDGILSVTPYYNKPSQSGLIAHYSAIANATDKPIILYNVPGRTQCNILPDTVVTLANQFKNIVAIKEASGSLTQCMELVQKLPSTFTILSGDDNLILPQISIGMKGVISVAANAYPKSFCKMVNAALKNEWDTARNINYETLDCTNALFEEGNPTGVKGLLSIKCIIQNELRLPLISASEKLMNKLQSYKNFD